MRHGKGDKERMVAIVDPSEGTIRALRSLRDAQGGGYTYVFPSMTRGRTATWARDITLAKNELHCALNSRQQFILALVEIDEKMPASRAMFAASPSVSQERCEESVKVNLKTLLKASAAPR